MAIAPDRLAGEPSTAYSAFLRWVEMGPIRPSWIDYSADLGRPYRTVRGWASRYDWKDRAAAADRAALDAAMAAREEDRERARQILLDAAPGTIATLLDTVAGRMAEGDTVPLLDRHGNPVGTRPAVPAATRVQAARVALEFAGITPPKRMEVTGKDGTELRLRARAALSDLTSEQLAALARAFGVDL